MKKIISTAILANFLLCGATVQAEEYISLYNSTNLAGHAIYAECNPGGGTHCDCSQDDASISYEEDYGTVTSNSQYNETWVNAIGYKKFIDTFPDGSPITLGTYKLSGEFRLPYVPKPDPNQHENGEGVHVMIQLWDGRDQLGEMNMTSLEGAIYWNVNPWTPDFGNIKVWINPIVKLDTPITIQPDLEWHHFELTVDFTKKEYVSIAVDDHEVDLQGVKIARVYHPEWGNDLGLAVSTESMASWPWPDCSAGAYSWSTDYRNIDFGRVTGQ